MNNKFILLSLLVCLFACNTTAKETNSTDDVVEVAAVDVTIDCHDPSLDVCVDPEKEHDYSQDICK